MFVLFLGKKREAYLAEQQKLKAGHRPRGGPNGSLTITDIRLPLKHDFYTKLGSPAGRRLHLSYATG